MEVILPTERKDLIDVIIVSRRSKEYMIDLLKQAADDPSTWARHHFIVVYDDVEHRNDLRTWIAENKENLTLPQITIAVARPGFMRNLPALRSQALEQGIHPYIYFQDDDDPLPQGIERRLSMMETSQSQAIFGVSQTISKRGQVVETFPVLSSGMFAYNPEEACKWFPTYVHFGAALYRRSLFKNVPLDDGKRYLSTGCLGFIVRLMNSGEAVSFLPDVVRHICIHSDNDTGILNKEQIENLLHDIGQWEDDIENEEIKAFHKLISRNLVSGAITTYREVAAQVEAVLEEGHATLE